jgi:membrane protein implicated in regulation of membrane protease activity
LTKVIGNVFSLFSHLRHSKQKRIGSPAMDKHGQLPSVVIRYILFQVPAFILFVLILILLGRWLDIPNWISWFLIFAWVAKDAILFPFVRKAYELNREGEEISMQGLKGVAKEQLKPSGYVRVHGELWKARLLDETRPIEQGERIKVHGIRGLVLIVTPENGDGSNDE